MENTRIVEFFTRPFALFAAPAETLQKAIEDKAVVDGVVYLVLNVAISALFHFLSPPEIPKELGLPKSALPTVQKVMLMAFIASNAFSLLNILTYYLGGLMWGGKGSFRDVVTAFGVVAIPTTLVNELSSLLPIQFSLGFILVPFIFDYLACREAHKFNNAVQVFMASIFSMFITAVLMAAAAIVIYLNFAASAGVSFTIPGM